jgi:signal transduction histidine kinase/DNA-binding response OmpR family regulator
LHVWPDLVTAPPRARNARILIVDGDARARADLCELLATHGMIELASTLAEAIAAIRACRPDAIVVDVDLPDGSGSALLDHVRGVDGIHVAVIFVSARTSADERASAIEAGAADYLVKPFAPRELSARVSTQLALAQVRGDAATIQRISNMLAAELELDRLAQLLTDETTALVGAEFGALFYNVIGEQNESYTLYALSGVPREAFSKFPMPRNTHVFAPTFRGEGVIRMDDVTVDPRYGKNPPHHGMPEGHLPVRSYLAAPVISRSGEVLGGLFFGHSEPGVFAERHERMVTGIAAQGAIAIDNARLHDRVRDLLDSEREAREQAEQANRAKDEFLAVLGHELRNPLAPIRTALQLMALRGDPRTRERLVIERQVGHLVRLVDDLLDVSRITRGKIELSRQRIELASVVGEALEMASPLLEQKQHRIVVDVPGSGLLVDVDPGRMAQVFSNLLTNAAKYTPPDGSVAVMASRRGDRIVVQVHDNGVGIAADSIERVFEPFVQDSQALDRARGGLGLGLTIVRNFVELHGGEVSVESPGEGLGSTFTVMLPVAARPTTADEDTNVTQPVRVQRPDARRVLVVDDNTDAADLVVATLSALGHHAEAAHDGPSALALASRLRPDLALLDIGLPVMDGYELARRLRTVPGLDQVRLVALTGYGTDRDRERSMEAGFDEHLVKPLALERLEQVLAAMARDRTALDRPT